MKTIYLFNSIFIFFIVFTASSQSNTVAGGGNANGSGGSLSYTIGQIDYISATGSNGSVNQGIQQPYEFFQSSGLSENGPLVNLKIGPNPTIDMLMISLNSNSDIEYFFNLYDSNGKVLIESTPLLIENTVDLVQIAKGNYFLNIISDETVIETHKIIKN